MEADHKAGVDIYFIFSTSTPRDLMVFVFLYIFVTFRIIRYKLFDRLVCQTFHHNKAFKVLLLCFDKGGNKSCGLLDSFTSNVYY